MAHLLEITVPRTTVATDPKPYTVYEILIRLSLQSLTLHKRYSDFINLHVTLKSQAGSAPPAPLPPKYYLSRTTNNKLLTESRRRGLEVYLQSILDAADSRWRETSAWRLFLNLPSNIVLKSSQASPQRILTGALADDGLVDPMAWLDVYRELQTILHEARQNVTARDGAGYVSVSHEKGTIVKKALVRAGILLTSLDQGLKSIQEEWGIEKLGEGEARRRKDLIVRARKERDDLDKLSTAIIKKRELDEVVGNKRFLGEGCAATVPGIASNTEVIKRGRIIGKETAATRELDNKRVLQLQQQMLQEQDDDIDLLAATVRRQKELATQINEELEVQTEMLDMVNEDATRLEGKVGVANNRVKGIH
ncbi:MAG: hypothetical protein LQ340_006685 [Diploschistes diacapsis]|nr:MAG: hypothetical protein LQ340_006685 [Diploschistes diacapsis]